jgi:hypothetical protein
MEAKYSSEMSIDFQRTTRRYKLGGRILECISSINVYLMRLRHQRWLYPGFYPEPDEASPHPRLFHLYNMPQLL